MIQLIVILILLLNTVFAFWTVFKNTRDIASSWAWLLVLLVPIIGTAVYFVIGRPIVGDRLRSEPAVYNAQRVALAEKQIKAVPLSSTRMLQRTLLKSTASLVTRDNQLRLYTDLDVFTERLFHDLRHAQSAIMVEAYSIEPDASGNEFLRILTERAQNGVRVDVLYDAFGSRRLPHHFWQPLRAAGGLVEAFGSGQWGWINPRVNFRNHRKIVIIDAHKAYTGGFNLGRQKNRPRLAGDLHLRVRGGGVWELMSIFVRDWNRTARTQTLATLPPRTPQQGTGSTVQFLPSRPHTQLSDLSLAYQRLIAAANDYVYIQSPYFIPDTSLLDALALAIGRGVDVRIMIPRQSDKRLLTRASLFYLEQLALLGARVFTYEGGFLRSKTLISEEVVALGTANFDPRSFDLNYEVTSFVYDLRFSSQLTDVFLDNQAAAKELTRQYFQNVTSGQRLRSELARLIAPIL